MNRTPNLLLTCLFAGNLFAQTLPDGKRLNGNGLLVGATAEVGSADKEGLFSWTDAAKVKTVMAREFGLVQTTSYPAWSTWGGSGINSVTFNMTEANQVINWAEGNGQKTAVHLLAGSPTYFPAWLNGGSWTAPQLDTLLNRWVTFAMTSNGNAAKVDYWNVVNEAFMWDGSYWDSSSTANTCPWQKMGWEADKSGLTGSAEIYNEHPVYIRRAFEMARKHTKAKLELRDYGIEFWDGSKKTRAFYQLVKHLVNSGAPIDAVGFQGHFRTDKKYDWTKLQNAVKQYRSLGLEVYITEVDYGDADPIAAATTAHRTASYDTTQAQELYAFTKAATAGGVNWICMWGVADNTNLYWRKGQSALLFDEAYNAKGSYYRFRQGIVDGIATVSVGAKPSRSVGFGTVGKDGRLHVSDMGDGEVELLDLRGNVRAKLDIRGGVGSLPSLPQGIYVIRTADAITRRGVVQVVP
jgi:GH35 family endo-1,4-beta-xylanase